MYATVMHEGIVDYYENFPMLEILNAYMDVWVPFTLKGKIK